MVRAWTFRIVILGMGLLALAVGAGDYWEYRTLQVDGIAAKAYAASPITKPRHFDDTSSVIALRYKTQAGEEITTDFYLDRAEAERIAKGGYHEFVYLRDDPRRRYRKGEELSKGVEWTLTGLALVGIFAVSLKVK